MQKSETYGLAALARASVWGKSKIGDRRLFMSTRDEPLRTIL
jgi:hypothetical protein